MGWSPKLCRMSYSLGDAEYSESRGLAQIFGLCKGFQKTSFSYAHQVDGEANQLIGQLPSSITADNFESTLQTFIQIYELHVVDAEGEIHAESGSQTFEYQQRDAWVKNIECIGTMKANKQKYMDELPLQIPTE